MKSTITVQTSETRHRQLKAYAASLGLTIREAIECAIDRLMEADLMPIDENVVKTEWENSPALRAEFGSLAAFLCYRKAVARGATRELKPRESQNAHP